jgi:hypothetical protein
MDNVKEKKGRWKNRCRFPVAGQKGRPKEQSSWIKELENGRQEAGVRKQDQD